ncbi:MAG: outer membrane lipoprotein-sorting protein [Candidatus Aminicenantes bacterium]|jgi:hypothetical protein
MRAQRKILAAAFLISMSAAIVLSGSETFERVDVATIVDETAERLESFPEMSHWQASVLSKQFEMDKNWEPKKVTVVQKTVLMKNKILQEKIQSAVEIKGDKRKDVTQKYINESYKEMQKAAKERRKSKDKNGEDDRRKHMDFSFDELFPFSEKNRVNYDFAMLKEKELEGTSVYVVEARAKQRTKDFFEGIFYIDKETSDIRRAELQLAKNPGPLKVMNMNLDLKVLPEGYLAVRKASVRIHVGLVVKNIRREVVDEYSDYKILEQ